MLTESMRKAGWREWASDEVRHAWEAKGGRWERLWCGQSMRDDMPIRPELSLVPVGSRWIPPVPKTVKADGYVPAIPEAECWRPVSASTWDYVREGWGETYRSADGHLSRMMLDGGVTITCLSERAPEGENFAILTVRGKDHDLDAETCREMAAVLLEAAAMLSESTP